MFRLILCLFIYWCFGFVTIHAADIGETVGYSIEIEGDSVSEGSIVCKENNKFVICSQEYSLFISGVYNEKPALFIDDNLIDSKPLISAGKAWVLVSTENGDIQKGDYITTSKKLGVGMKAARSGFVLGVALEDFSSEDKGVISKIPVLVSIKSIALDQGSGGNLLDSVRQGFVFPSLDALSSFRYWIAILICIVSFTIGFIYYGRISKTGIEAMGRNPLAGRMIQLNIVMNIILITLIMIGGLGLAYAIVVI